MRIDIIGGGALGLLFFSKLARNRVEDEKDPSIEVSHSNSLHLWTRTIGQAERIREQGITLREGSDSNDTYHISPSNRVHCSVDAVQSSTDHTAIDKADLILLTVKQQHVTPELIEWLAGRVHNHTVIMMMQNGLRTELLWPEAWQVYVAVTTEGAKKLSPIEVVHSGQGQTHIGHAKALHGSPAGLSDTEHGSLYEEGTIAILLKWLQKAGFVAAMSKNIEIEVYRKLTINAVINPLTALWRIPNGELLVGSDRMKIMRQLFDEAMAVYTKNDIGWSESWWNDIVQVCHATSTNTSSMLADVLHGRTTEIRWINGAIVDLAKRVHIEVPAHEWMLRLIESLTVEEAD